MLQSIITWSLHHRILVIAGALALTLAGWLSLVGLNIDAFPDTTPVQVQINTVAPALVATEVERLITFPIELAIGGMPGLQDVRSISQFGLSQVTVTFEDGTDIYRARQMINERLTSLEMPAGMPRPEMGPVATGLGEVFHYVLVPQGPEPTPLTDLRTVQDWVMRPELRSIPGTAEINSWGGLEKQYQVRVDPASLFRHDVTFQQVIQAVLDNNLNVGGGYIDRSGDMLLVHGIARTVDVKQIGEIVITSHEGLPVCVRDVAEIAIGHEIRRGVVTVDGAGEAVLGLGFMRIGENSYGVTQRIREGFQNVLDLLPKGMRAITVYDRTDLVDDVIATVKQNLLDGALLVILILYIFLGNLRAGLIAAVTIPLSMLFAFCGMYQIGLAGTLLSLGAIDFGIVVDSSVVVIENIVRHLSHPSHAGGLSRLEKIRLAAIEVRNPTVFGQLIIMIVYIPILTLEGVEGKMFRPMALTVILVLTGSLILSLTLTPVLASFVLPQQTSERDVFLVRAAQWIYGHVLRLALRCRLAVLGLAGAALAIAVLMALGFGSEFVPRLSEGSIVVGVRRVPGTSFDQSALVNSQMERALLAAFPDEISHAWSRVGEPKVNTDAGSPETTDIFVTLNPRKQWTKASTQDELVQLMEQELSQFKGQVMWFTQPIEMRINEMLTGVRADVAIKLFGEDIDELVSMADRLEDLLRSIPGSADLATDDVAGQPILQIRLNQEEIARYGITAETVLNVVEAVSGKGVGEVLEGQLRFPLAIRLPEVLRASPASISGIMVSAPSGERIPLSRVANIQEIRGPKLITREWGKRRISIQCNVRGRDVGSFVAEAQRRIAKEIQLPTGFRIDWGGQFENMQRAQKRLMIVVPLALMLIIALLFFTYRNVIDTLFIFTSVPFACVGGVVAVWVRDMPLSVSAAVGFITLSGVSVLNSMVVVSALKSKLAEGLAPREAIEKSVVSCLRTVLMTALVASVGFIPMATSIGTGAEVQRPLATVVIGGVISSTLMSLLVLPVLYSLLGSRIARQPVLTTHSG
ncbi:MAG: efflux RND transporter permease subunit [Planctomycetes bacterium]|nr:efflux RND transporter permease subunit [Planctomycetota bacterium]